MLKTIKKVVASAFNKAEYQKIAAFKDNEFRLTTYKFKRSLIWWREIDINEDGAIISSGRFNFTHYKKVLDARRHKN